MHRQFRQYKKDNNTLNLYKPADVLLGNWGSSLNGSSSNGTDPFVGVNPANGLVTYYTLPELPKDTEVVLEIKDSNGYLVRRISSKEDKSFQKYPGGPSAEPKLSAVSRARATTSAKHNETNKKVQEQHDVAQ